MEFSPFFMVKIMVLFVSASNFDLSVCWDTSSVGYAATFPSRGRLGLTATTVYDTNKILSRKKNLR
jgi:hypothetical protein